MSAPVESTDDSVVMVGDVRGDSKGVPTLVVLSTGDGMYRWRWLPGGGEEQAPVRGSNMGSLRLVRRASIDTPAATPTTLAADDNARPGACLRCGTDDDSRGWWMHNACFSVNVDESAAWCCEWDRGARDFPRGPTVEPLHGVGLTNVIIDECANVKFTGSLSSPGTWRILAVDEMVVPYAKPVQRREVGAGGAWLDYERLSTDERDPFESYPRRRIVEGTRVVEEWPKREMCALCYSTPAVPFERGLCCGCAENRRTNEEDIAVKMARYDARALKPGDWLITREDGTKFRMSDADYQAARSR